MQKTLTDITIKKQTAYLADLISHAEYKLDGEVKRVDLLKKNVKENEVKFYVYFDDSVVGMISDVVLIDTDGDVAVVSHHTFNKEAYRGLYILFQYRLVEEEDLDAGL